MIAYAISDPETLRFDRLGNDLACLASRADFLLYRDKNNPDYAVFAKRFIREARRYPRLKILLHDDPALARDLGADGVHLSSANFGAIPDAKRFGLLTIASTHSLEEALNAQELGGDIVTLSPVFFSPGKGRPLGLEQFASIVSSLSVPVFALGGILSPEIAESCRQAGAAGFASIRFFACR